MVGREFARSAFGVRGVLAPRLKLNRLERYFFSPTLRSTAHAFLPLLFSRFSSSLRRRADKDRRSCRLLGIPGAISDRVDAISPNRSLVSVHVACRSLADGSTENFPSTMHAMRRDRLPVPGPKLSAHSTSYET